MSEENVNVEEVAKVVAASLPSLDNVGGLLDMIPSDVKKLFVDAALTGVNAALDAVSNGLNNMSTLSNPLVRSLLAAFVSELKKRLTGGGGLFVAQSEGTEVTEQHSSE